MVDFPVVSDNYVTFFGSSDNLIQVKGRIPGCDEFNTDGAEFECGGLKIAVAYGTTGCWHIGVGQISEHVPVLARVYSLRANGYTMELTLAVPMGTYVTKLNN